MKSTSAVTEHAGVAHMYSNCVLRACCENYRVISLMLVVIVDINHLLAASVLLHLSHYRSSSLMEQVSSLQEQHAEGVGDK